MTFNFGRKTIRSIARRTLGRSENDEAPISSVYTAHLKHFLSAHSDEQDFTIDLDNGNGSVYCRVCQHELPPGDGEPEEDGKDIFGSLHNFEEHVITSAHRSRKAAVGAGSVQQPVFGTSDTAVISRGRSITPNPPYFVDLTESSPVRVISNSFRNAEPQDVDEDYLLAMKLDEEWNGPRQYGTIESERPTAMRLGPVDADEDSGVSVEPDLTAEHSAASGSASGPLEYEVSQDEPPFPFEETYHAQILGILSNLPDESPNSYTLYRESPEVIQIRCLLCHFSIAMPGSGSFEIAIDDAMEGITAYEEHLKSPLHVRKKTGALEQAASWDSNSGPASHERHPQATSSDVQTDGSGKGKRKLPDTWYFAGEAGPSSNSHRPGDGFTQASAILQALEAPDDLQEQNGSSVEYHHVGPAPDSVNNPYEEGTALYAAREIAIRRLQESQIAALDGYGSYRGMNEGDFNINYDEGGPASRIDYGGADLDKCFRDFMTKALEEFKGVTTVTDAQKKLKMRTENDLLDGMQVPLLPHQIIGVAWMIDQEKDENKLGGILADAMGLGKTVQMIATMTYNRPPQKAIESDFFDRHRVDKGKAKGVEHVRRTTLVLAPASLLQQWYEEFDDKATPGVFRVHIHHGKDKLKTVWEIEEYDVIIASHQSIVMDFPKEKKKKDTMGQGNDDEDSSEDDIPVANRKSVGPLARVQWLRVVIDEAQNIRNRSTRISTCAAKLDSRYRWCLTGTPVTNTLADIYGFMRFCRFAPWNDWKMFNQSIAKVQRKNPKRAGEKAQAILKPHLLRRTKDSKLDGRPIIRLGPKTIDMIELDFSPEEREKKVVSRFLKEGTVMKNYSFILVMILRLRQLCCHPKLATTEAETEQMDADKQRAESTRAEKLMGAQKVKEVKERFKSRVLQRMKAELGLAELEDDDCAVCMEPIIENRRVTSCAHEFCSVCMNEVVQQAKGRNVEEDALCPLCRARIDERHIFIGTIFEPSPEDIDELTKNLPSPSDDERPLKKLKVDEAVQDSVTGKEESIDFKGKGKAKDKVEPSTKMQRMLQTVMELQRERPGDKAIVYSQWTSMLDLVEDYLKEFDIEVVRYDGRMNRLARVESVARFKKPRGPPIMLVSLKCGGVGLNLTVANHVINLDLAWNYATEAQAYDRVHRLGQQKAVEVRRLVVRGTIEERIIRLQAKKQGLSDAALGEGTGNKLQRLTARDIAQLFDL